MNSLRNYSSKSPRWVKQVALVVAASAFFNWPGFVMVTVGVVVYNRLTKPATAPVAPVEEPVTAQ